MNYVELKSCYRKNLKIGLGISLILHLFIIFFFLIFMGTDVQDENQPYGSRLTYIDLGPDKSNISPGIVPGNGGRRGQKSVSGVPVPSKNVTEDKELNKADGDSTKKGPGGNGPIGGSGGSSVNVFRKADYLIAVEMQPEPVGGQEAIDKRVVYPESARNNLIQGKVFLQVYINENGEVVFAEVLKGLGSGCDEAAIRAVKSVRFKAGKHNGRYVKVQMSIPVNFRIK